VTELVEAFDARPTRHAYSCGVIQFFLQMALSAIGFRPAARALQIMRSLLPHNQAPSANGGQFWLLRLGLYELKRPKEPADDWVWLIDNTIQTGNGKCLLVVGVRLSQWNAKRLAALEKDPEASFALAHQDLSVFDIELMESSNGSAVQQHLEQLSQQTGIMPCAILSDQGPDVRPGALRFSQAADRSTVVIHDIAHGVANALKRQLQQSPEWERFLVDANRSKTQIRQTPYAFLMPPELKNKARWMNLQPLIDWSRRVQHFLDDPAAALAKAEAPGDLEMLEQKMGWLRPYGPSIDQWSEMLQAAGITLKYIRNHGYHAQAHQELTSLLGGFAEGPVAAMVAEVLEFVAAQSSLCGERSFPGSTEVLESLIGKGKQQMGRNKNGYTKTVLGMAAAVVDVSKTAIETALQTVKVRELRNWIQQKLGMSLQAQRQRALPALISGTKIG
jgi:hypothetical protein